MGTLASGGIDIGSERRTSGWGLLGLVALAIGLGTIGLGCREETPPEKSVTRPIKIMTLGGDRATRTLEYPGRIEAGNHAELGFEVAGRLVAFPVQEGQTVEQGQELARIDPRDYEAEVDAKKALVNAARADLDRTRLLFDEEVKSRQELERAQRNAEVREANLRIAQKALEDTVLRAPFAGTVARKLVDDFRNVQAKEPVLVLQNDATLEIVANIPERDWAFARKPSPGRNVGAGSARFRPRVVVSTYPDRVFPAELAEVATTADPTTRTYAITLRLDPPDDISILPGMSARVVVDLPAQRVAAGFSVPARAVVGDAGDGPYVWRIEPDSMTAARAPVELGQLSGESIEILAGLEPGDRIAISGVHQLRDGMAVRALDD